MKKKKKTTHKPLFKQAPYKEDGLRPVLGGYDPELDKYSDPKNRPEWARKSLEEANRILKSSDLSIFDK